MTALSGDDRGLPHPKHLIPWDTILSGASLPIDWEAKRAADKEARQRRAQVEAERWEEERRDWAAHKAERRR